MYKHKELSTFMRVDARLGMLKNQTSLLITLHNDFIQAIAQSDTLSII